MGGGSVRDASDVLAHKRNQRCVFEVWDEKLALHLHDLVLTEQMRQCNVDTRVQGSSMALTLR